jgi:DNA-binding MarR family transcriptional regulator/N-acetylglutamate synthase-like GNAT family acetyltransferase
MERNVFTFQWESDNLCKCLRKWFHFMDFYFQAGKLALGSRLRRLSERFTEDATQIFTLYDVPLDPRWFPVFYVLSQQPEASITEIAQFIGHSHASVSQIVKEMSKNGLALTAKSEADARVNVVRLSDAGKQIIPNIQYQYLDVAQAVDQLLADMQHDLWKAIAEVEHLLAHKSFYQRVREVRKMRESQQVEILDYSPEWQADFKRLNYQWIEKYFTVEEADEQVLNYPQEKILNPGGCILMARYNGEMVGTCALIKMDAVKYELAKMAVAEHARGKRIGWLLGQAAIQRARELGAEVLYLESNTMLEPAINLYYKLGFQRVIGHTSCYERCNIQMELKLVEVAQ